jgi:hypothetical protein
MADLSKQDKIAILRKEFLEMDMNHDDFITKDELYFALDKKVKFYSFNYFLISILILG